MWRALLVGGAWLARDPWSRSLKLRCVTMVQVSPKDTSSIRFTRRGANFTSYDRGPMPAGRLYAFLFKPMRLEMIHQV